MSSLNGVILSEEFAVTEGDSSRTVNTYDILIELFYLHYQACLIPFSGVRASLVLYADVVPGLEGR